MADKRKGLKPKERALATKAKGELTGNQWQNTPKQNLFMELWLDPASKTFGNAYGSALEAGYSRSYAIQIAAPAINNKWIQEYTKGTVMDAEHTKKALQDVYLNPETYQNSRSPADTRLKALELMLKVNGQIDSKNQVNIGIQVQPILNGESVSAKTRTTVDSTQTSAKTIDNSIRNDIHQDTHIVDQEQ